MPKFNLEDFQRNFYHFITDEETHSSILTGVTQTPRLNEAMELYRQGLVARLTEALGETYESIWMILGDELFFQICREYSQVYPSTVYNLTNYGNDFPHFIKKHKDLQDYFWLKSLAALELSVKKVFHQASPHSLSQENFLKLQEDPSLKLKFSLSHQFLSLEYEVIDIWEGLQDQGQDFELKKKERNNEETLFIYKSDNAVFVKKLSKEQGVILKKLISGISLIQTIDLHENICTEKNISIIFEFIGSSGIVTELY